jgi:hypothetical protein
MSKTPDGEKVPVAAETDPLLAALRLLPSRTMDDSAESRLQRQARAAYVRSFEPSPWPLSGANLVGRAAVPVFLAGVVGIYMMWAIAAATAIVH